MHTHYSSTVLARMSEIRDTPNHSQTTVKKANDGAPSGFPAKFNPVLVVLPLILNPFQLFSREFKVFQTRPREKSAGFSLYRSRAVVSWAAQPRGVGDNVPHFWDQRGTGASNENDLCFYSRQSLFSTVRVTEFQLP